MTSSPNKSNDRVCIASRSSRVSSPAPAATRAAARPGRATTAARPGAATSLTRAGTRMGLVIAVAMFLCSGTVKDLRDQRYAPVREQRALLGAVAADQVSLGLRRLRPVHLA